METETRAVFNKPPRRGGVFSRFMCCCGPNGGNDTLAQNGGTVTMTSMSTTSTAVSRVKAGANG